MEDNFYKTGQALVSWGANLALVPPSMRVNTDEVLDAVLNTMERPTSRRVGAVLSVLHNLSVEAPDTFLQLRSLPFDRSTEVVRRLGYLLERGSFSRSSQQRWREVADSLYANLQRPQKWDDADFLALLDRVRPSVLKGERDATHLKWGVLAPKDVWGEYVGQFDT